MAEVEVAPEVAPATTKVYATEPAFNKKFRESKAKEIIEAVLKAKLTGVNYHPDNTSTVTREIADEIKIKLKELELEKYKYVVQVVIGEQRGEGLQMGCRCFWDKNTDNYAKHEFTNESLFCIAAAFGVYLY